MQLSLKKRLLPSIVRYAGLVKQARHCESIPVYRVILHFIEQLQRRAIFWRRNFSGVWPPHLIPFLDCVWPPDPWFCYDSGSPFDKITTTEAV
jgi:hypothetical protein